MKARRLITATTSLALALVSSVATAAGSWTTYELPTSLRIDGGDTGKFFRILMPTLYDPGNCQHKVYTIRTTDVNYDAMVSMLLAAKLSGTPVRLYVDHTCQPEGHIRVLNVMLE
ncbi:MAG: hypothetical protein AAGA68_02485 [Pseudomonadota bacterium]